MKLLEIKGKINGKEGFFQYIIKPDNTINHRFFVPKSDRYRFVKYQNIIKENK